MIDLEQMRKDMEAGTQGDAWVIGDRGASIYVEGDGKPYRYAERVGGAVHDYDGGSDLEFSEADLRRIARVPQLEREYIALREAADALAKSLNDMIVDPDFFRPYARATLTRYEAALGERDT